MENVLWLSGDDVIKTGVCKIENAVKLVEEAFRLFNEKKALIVEESALRLTSGDKDQACYILPAYVGGDFNVCGLKWSAHGKPLDNSISASRIQASVIINEPERGVPLAVMNGTEIGAARTGAVTALALRQLAPASVKKVALCGAGGQAEHQLQAIIYALESTEEIAIWSRGHVKAERLAELYKDRCNIRIYSADTLKDAVSDADVIVGATSASTPYLTKDSVSSAALYCHIGFNEIEYEAVRQFKTIVTDTWDEAKDVSGQTLFRLYREGRINEKDITGTLGEILTGKLKVHEAARTDKIMFDAFGLPIFDLALASAAYKKAVEEKIGTHLPW